MRGKPGILKRMKQNAETDLRATVANLHHRRKLSSQAYQGYSAEKVTANINMMIRGAVTHAMEACIPEIKLNQSRALQDAVASDSAPTTHVRQMITTSNRVDEIIRAVLKNPSTTRELLDSLTRDHLDTTVATFLSDDIYRSDLATTVAAEEPAATIEAFLSNTHHQKDLVTTLIEQKFEAALKVCLDNCDARTELIDAMLETQPEAVINTIMANKDSRKKLVDVATVDQRNREDLSHATARRYEMNAVDQSR